MEMVLLALGTLILAIVANELLKRASKASRTTYCQVCGQTMQPVSTQWGYAPPTPIWWVLGKHRLPSSQAKKYLCPSRHTYLWRVSPNGDLKYEVSVTGFIKSK